MSRRRQPSKRERCGDSLKSRRSSPARGFKGGYQRVVRKSSRSKTRYQYRPQSVRMRCCRIECKQILSTTSSVSTLAMMVVIHGHFRLKFFHDVRLTQPSEIADDVRNSMFHLVLRRGRGKKSLPNIVQIWEKKSPVVDSSISIVTRTLHWAEWDSNQGEILWCRRRLCYQESRRAYGRYHAALDLPLET